MLRLVLTAMLGALLVFPAHAQKAGVGAWEDAEYSIVNWIEDVPALGWYYTWRPDQIWSAEPRRRSVEFVPMIHSERDLDRAIVSDTDGGIALDDLVYHPYGLALAKGAKGLHGRYRLIRRN